MKRLKTDLKQMLNGLAYQNASDFLTRQQKMDVLSNIPVQKKVKTVVSLMADTQQQEEGSIDADVLVISAA